MLVNIEILEKPVIQTKATFKTEHFAKQRDFKEALAIVFMISADYYLDPELGPEDLSELVAKAKEESKENLCFFVSEEGLELEFV